MINGAFIEFMERGLLPDRLVRFGIRQMCRRRLHELSREFDQNGFSIESYANELRQGLLASHSHEANQQHYEVPTEFYNLVLGEHRKYSCAYFETPDMSLAEAERIALAKTVERAELVDGQKVLELGCGWGSLTLYMAARFPKSSILAISNSQTQREFILRTAAARGLSNVEVKTLDLSRPEALESLNPRVFDRVISVEMFEHFKNYQILLQKVVRLLKPEGKLFVHIFTHRQYAYSFETEGEDNWMGKYFFTGGQMPSRDLFKHFQDDLKLEKSWDWNGRHYQYTAEAWLRNLDSHRREVEQIFSETYGPDAKRWVERWRVFFMACSELFGFRGGEEWGVTHYLFTRRPEVSL